MVDYDAKYKVNPPLRTKEDLEAVILSHEIDHLDGILHIDIAEEVIEMTYEEKKKYRMEHPYEIISKE